MEAVTIRKPPKRRRFKQYLPLYLMALPGLAFLFINNYLPLEGLVIAFQKYNYKEGIRGSAWVGFKNFEYLFKTKDAWIMTRNTIGYNLAFILLNMALGILFAIFLNEIRKNWAKKTFQTLILLPYLTSLVVVSYLCSAFLSQSTGIVNAVIRAFGGQNINWYLEKKYWPFILTFVNTWRTIGFETIIYLSSIVGISNEYYEAAELDGASKWQQITGVTIPMLKPTVIMLVTISFGRIFRSDFGLFYQVPRNSGMLFDVTQTIDTYVYRALLQQGDIGMSAAAAFYQSVICLFMILLFNALMKKLSREDALF